MFDTGEDAGRWLKAHSVIWVPLKRFADSPLEIPALITRDPNDEPVLNMNFLRYSEQRAKNGARRAALTRAANIVGFLADYAMFAIPSPILSEDDIEAFLIGFLKHRYCGTVAADGSDDTGLGWRPIRWVTVSEDRRHVLDFITFCVNESGYYPPLRGGAVAAPSGELPGRIRWLFRAPGRALLSHLDRHRAPIAAADRIVLPGLRTPGNNRGLRPSSAGGALPTEEALRVISSTTDPVQKAIFILCFFGGPRMSEVIQIWTDDVLPRSYTPKLFDGKSPGAGPLVVLAHPNESSYTGEVGRLTHSRLQKLSSMGLTPRYMLPDSDPMRAGWKGMDWDNERSRISKVFWIDREMASLFERLCDEILDRRSQLSAAAKHPWLFVNLDPRQPEVGQPVKIHGVRKAFYSACERAGLEPHRGHATIHRARSHYDQLLIEAGFGEAERSHFLHHKSVVSERPYAKDMNRMHAALEKYFDHKEGILS